MHLEVLDENAARRNVLTPGEVHVWCRATDDLDETSIAEAVALLSPDERSRHSRFVFAQDRRDYAVAHALVRTSLSRYADVSPEFWRFQHDVCGKPSIVPDDGVPRLSFNLSHTRGFVACAITNGAAVGIDVEVVDSVIDQSVANSILSKSEKAELLRYPSEFARVRRFFELWTLKEAYAKATGKGLMHPLVRIAFEFGASGSVVLASDADADSHQWQFALFSPTARHSLAVALRRQCESISRIEMMSTTRAP